MSEFKDKRSFLPADVFDKLTGERWHSGYAYRIEKEAMNDLHRVLKAMEAA